MDLRSFGPYNIFWVTDRSIYCHMTLGAMNYLLYSYYYIYNSYNYYIYELTFKTTSITYRKKLTKTKKITTTTHPILPQTSPSKIEYLFNHHLTHHFIDLSTIIISQNSLRYLNNTSMPCIRTNRDMESYDLLPKHGIIY